MKYLYALGIFLCLAHGVGNVKTNKNITKQSVPKLEKPTKSVRCSRCGFDLYNRSNMILASRHSDGALRHQLSKQDELCLMKIIKVESNYRVYAKNRRSSARGLGQLLKSTLHGVNKTIKKQNRCPIDYQSLCPSCQMEATKIYIKSRYGTPTRAWRFWRQRHWY